jgi:Cdc6-like AAA superfamily ATPase
MSQSNTESWLRRFAPVLGGRKAAPVPVSRAPAAPFVGALTAADASTRAQPARGLKLPKFRSNASDQVDRRGVDQIGAARLKLRDAYTPAQPITDPWKFAGRTALLTRIIRAIEDQRLHAIIYGARGIGKTSLLHVLSGMALEARYQVSYVTCGATATFSEMFRSAAASVPLRYHADFGPTSARSEEGGTLLDLLPAGDLSPRLASEFCAKINGTRLLIMLDEFNRPSSSGFNHDVAEFIKNLSDRAVRVQVVVAGVAEDLDELLQSNGIVQRNVLAIQIPRMAAGEIAELIRSGEAVGGISFQKQAQDAIGIASAGMPYLASLVCQHAALVSLGDARLDVTVNDVKTAVAEALADIGARLPKGVRERLEARTRGGSLALYAIASFAYLTGQPIPPEGREATVTNKIDGALLRSEILWLQSQDLLRTESGAQGELRCFFKDENDVLFLWLLFAQHRLLGSDIEASV